MTDERKKYPNKLYTGNLCLTDLFDAAKNGHSSIYTYEKNGKLYAAIMMWHNEEPDQRGNTHKIQLNSKKELKENEERVYFGWLKIVPEPLPTQIAPETGESKVVYQKSTPESFIGTKRNFDE